MIGYRVTLILGTAWYVLFLFSDEPHHLVLSGVFLAAFFVIASVRGDR